MVQRISTAAKKKWMSQSLKDILISLASHTFESVKNIKSLLSVISLAIRFYFSFPFFFFFVRDIIAIGHPDCLFVVLSLSFIGIVSIN